MFCLFLAKESKQEEASIEIGKSCLCKIYRIVVILVLLAASS
jgi:hypothetical protein